jgi:hypothetical protein
MTIEHDDNTDELAVPEADPINVAIGPLITAVVEMTEPGSRTRAKAMSEVLDCAERVKSALRQPTIN